MALAVAAGLGVLDEVLGLFGWHHQARGAHPLLDLNHSQQLRGEDRLRQERTNLQSGLVVP